MIFFRTLCLMAVLFCIVGCGQTPPTEVYRLTSPDNKVDAIVAKKETDATAGLPFFLYIVPKGGHITESEPILIADSMDNAQVKWRASKKLVVSFSSGRIFSFSNFWQSSEIDNFQYSVNVYLDDASAPE